MLAPDVPGVAEMRTAVYLHSLAYMPIQEEFDPPRLASMLRSHGPYDGRLGLLWGEARTLAAESDVSATSPYLVPGERGMEIFDGLGRRHVGLTLLANSLAANDVPLVRTLRALSKTPAAKPGRPVRAEPNSTRARRHRTPRWA